MILHFLLSNCFFASENYDNFSDVLDKFIKTDNLLRKNQDKLFYDSSFYTDFALYNAIWAGFKDTQTIIASLNKREYDYIQRFFSRTFSAANTDSFEEFEQQNMLNKGIVGWYKGVFLKDKFMATIEDWYHLHYLHFQQNQDDTSYFIYSEDKHLEIENTLLSESYNYLPAIPQLQYIDIPRPNNPNGGNGLFMVEEEFYFIFPNLHISNLLKSWHLIYAKASPPASWLPALTSAPSMHWASPTPGRLRTRDRKSVV